MGEPVVVKASTKNVTPLDKFHRAVLSGKLHKIWDIATTKGFLVDAYNEDGQTALFCAAYKGLADVVVLLLGLGAKPNARCQPEQYTPVHGACYFGSTRILKLLLQAGGDLRLCDNQGRRPIAWCFLQMDSLKVQAIRKVIEDVRACTLKTNEVDILKDVRTSLSYTNNKAFMEKVRKALRRNGRHPEDINLSLNFSGGIHFTGFGQSYFGSGRKCASILGLPCISDVDDLENERDADVPSWLCGKFTEFTPKLWVSSRTQVTTREINKMTGPHCTSDILITELEILSKLHHPRILMLLGVSQTNHCETVVLVFERVHIGSLYHILHTNWKPLNVIFVTDIVIQICEALEYIHSQKMIHCAVTSHSIMLVSNGQAKLSCFEYVMQVTNGNSQEALLSPHPLLSLDAHVNALRHWMAPEVLLEKNISIKIDVYSLTSVMWEICYNEIPWRDFSLQALRQLFSQTQETLSINRKLTPTHWYHLLALGLSVKKEDRDLDIIEIRDMMILKKKQMTMDGVGDCDSLWGSTKATAQMQSNHVELSDFEANTSRVNVGEADGNSPQVFRNARSTPFNRRKRVEILSQNPVKVLHTEKHVDVTHQKVLKAFGTPSQAANRGPTKSSKSGKPPLPPQYSSKSARSKPKNEPDKENLPDICELENKLNECKLLSSQLQTPPVKPKRKWIGWNRPNKIDNKGTIVPPSLTSTKSSSSLHSQPSCQQSAFGDSQSNSTLSTKSSSSSLLPCFSNSNQSECSRSQAELKKSKVALDEFKEKLNRMLEQRLATHGCVSNQHFITNYKIV